MLEKEQKWNTTMHGLMYYDLSIVLSYFPQTTNLLIIHIVFVQHQGIRHIVSRPGGNPLQMVEVGKARHPQADAESARIDHPDDPIDDLETLQRLRVPGDTALPQSTNLTHQGGG
jgi:hypothetical protein